MRRILGVVLVASGLVIATASGAARASSPSELSLPGPAFFPESITAAPNGALFVSSLVTGEIVRFTPGSSKPKTFVGRRQRRHRGSDGRPRAQRAVGLRRRPQLLPTPSELRAFDLRTGALEASYPIPTAGCARTSRSRAATCT